MSYEFNSIGERERRRIHQVKRYLAAHWPAPFPVSLRIERLSDSLNAVGITYRSKRGLIIRLDSRMQCGYALEVLIHEWAHAATWPATSKFEDLQVREGVSDHCGAWQGKFAEIVTAFCEGDAAQDSKTW